MTFRELSRRRFLERLGLTTGAYFLTPVLGGILRNAYGQTVTARRYLQYDVGNGVNVKQLATAGYTDPLNPISGDVTKLYHLFTPFSKVDGVSHGAGVGTFTGADGGWESPRRPSFDTVISGELVGDAPVRHAVFGDPRSAAGPGRMLSGKKNPQEALDEYFKGAAAAASSLGEDRKARDKHFFDFMVGDIKRAQGALAGEEKRKLEGYLSAVEEMAGDVARRGPRPTCDRPDIDNLGDVGGEDGLSVRVRKFSIIAAHLLACNLTRCVSIGVDSGQETIFTQFGARKKLHDMYHAAEGNGFRSEFIRKVMNFHCQRLADMHAILKRYPENDGTAADNTLMVYMSHTGSHHNGFKDMGVVMVGKSGGAIKQPGRVIDLKQKYHMNEFWVTLAKALGTKLDTFGDTNKAPVRELITELI